MRWSFKMLAAATLVAVFCSSVRAGVIPDKRGSLGKIETLVVKNRTVLPPEFYTGHNDNFVTPVLSPDGKVVATIMAPWKKSEGRAYRIDSGKLTKFWGEKLHKAPVGHWRAMTTTTRLSCDGSLVCFAVEDDKGHSWQSVVAVTATDGEGSPDFFDLFAFLRSTDGQIDGCRGVQDIAISGDGKIIYATVPYHRKEDGNHARSYPIRRAIVRIERVTGKMVLVGIAKHGESHYPLMDLVANMSGNVIACAGADSSGKGRIAHAWMKLEHAEGGTWRAPFSGNIVQGPQLVGKMDSGWLTVSQDKVLRHGRWDQPGTYYQYGDEDYDGVQYSVDRVSKCFVSYDGNHAVYGSGRGHIWMDFTADDGQGRGCLIPRVFKGKGLEIYAMTYDGAIPFLSEDGTRMLLLHRPTSNKSDWRIVVQDMGLPGAAVVAGSGGSSGGTEGGLAGLIPEDSEVGKKLELDALVLSKGIQRTKAGNEYRTAFASYAPVGLDPSEDVVDLRVFVAKGKALAELTELKKRKLGDSPKQLGSGEWGLQTVSGSRQLLLFSARGVLVEIAGPPGDAGHIAALVEAKIEKGAAK